ncbi:MAG: methyl-accepting chemotaxis protein [Acidimicrobiales bacterium]
MVVLAAVAFVAVQNWVVNGRIRVAFEEVEADLVEQQIIRIEEAIAAEQRTLARLTRIDAVWSEPFQALITGDLDAVPELYPPEDLFANYDIEAMMVLDAGGRPFAGGHTAGAAGAFVLEEGSWLARDAEQFHGGPSGEGRCGLWRGNGVSLYCTHPVLRTDGSGPAAGWLTFFQPVDQALTARLSERLQLPLQVYDEAPVAESTILSEGSLRLAASIPVDNAGEVLQLVAEVSRPVTQQAARAGLELLWAVLGCVAVAVTLLLAMIDVVVVRRTVRMTRLARAIERTGDLQLRLPVKGGDELSALGESMNDMLDAISRHEEEVRRASDSRSAAEHALDEARQAVGAAGREVLGQLDVVVDSTEALRQGAGQINQSADTAAALTLKARQTVQGAQCLVDELSKSVGTIEQMAGLIASIAQDTNLLALNASIEAARAGELGRGFAVVAGRVKELARKTSESTSSIDSDVQAMRDRMAAIVGSIGQIGSLSDQIDQAALNIAASAGHQRDVTEHVATIIAHSRRDISSLVEV